MTTTQEIWKPISGYGGHYEVSTHGKVRNTRTGKIRSQSSVDRDGYPITCIYHVGKSKTIRIHRLVVETFIGEIGKMMVNHIDGNKKNNRVENLEIVSNRSNMTHCLTKDGRLTGACYCKRDKKWQARIRHDGKHKFLGYFATEREASDAYMAALSKFNLENKYARK